MRTLLLFLFIATSLAAPAQSWEHFRMAENPCQLVVSDSMIWIGGQDFGLVGMNPATAAREVTYRQDNSPILDDEIVALEAGPTGSLWIGHTRGLSIKHGDQWITNQTLTQEIWHIAPLTATEGWVQTIEGKLWWFDGEAFRDSLQMSQSGNQSQAYWLKTGIDGDAWVSTLDGLLFLGKSQIDTISWDGTPWSTNNSYPILLPDQQGGVWVSGSFRDTFAYYRPVTGWTTYPVGTWSSSVTLDKQDRLWLAQQYSLLHWTPAGIEETRKQIGTLYTNEDAFRIDEEGNIWTTTSDVQGGRGVAVRYGLDGTRTYFTADPHSLWSRGVNAMALDSSGALYVSPDFGGPLSRYHPDTREWDLIDYSSNMAPRSWRWRDITSDPQGRIWAFSRYHDFDRNSTIDFDGVQVFDPVTNEWTFLYGLNAFLPRKFSQGSGSPIALTGSPVYLINADTLAPLSMPSPFPNMEQMSALVWDQQDRLWAIQTDSRYPRHIWVYEEGQWDELSFAQDSIVQWQSVLVDERDVKWLVAKSGVLVVDERFSKSLGRGETWLNRADLGLMGDEEITAAQIGPQGYLWMATSWFRILRYDCEGTQVYALSGNDLPIPVRPFLSMVVDQKGRIFLGTAFDGMYLLSLDQAFPTTPACMLEAQPVSDNWIAYPNPATDNITFSHGDPAVGTVQVQWYDLSGRLVRQESLDYQHPGFTSSVEGMISGMYFIEITSESRTWTLKVWVR